ncbi:MAG: hypothetical protein AUH85_15545 [Chloroflexi bacterium 13_1_40CM_4_68_4]|nr:MAG: hypothetical protein AUH85_15545 [Chloroflexi bacterium 13_1_40CM_4_68_4]
MSLPMLRRAVLDERGTVFWYSLGVFVYVVIVLQFWPTAKRNADLFAQYITSFPKAFLEAFGVTDFTSFPGFVGAELLNFMWPLIASVFVVMAASAVVAGEVDRGTVELWLSVPERRWRLLAAKLAALVVGIVVFAAASMGAVAVGGALVGETVSTSGALAATGVLVAYCAAIGGYTALFSAASSRRGAAASLAATITLASYLASVIAGLSPDWDALRYVSLMSAYHPQRALAQGTVPGEEIAALLSVGIACAVVALVVFERRDVAP